MTYRVWQTVTLIIADSLAFLSSFIVAAGLMWLFRAERIGSTLLVWWHTAGQTQFVVFILLALTAIALMAWQGHYTLRIPFWDELIRLVKLLALFSLLNGMVVLLIKLAISRFLWPMLWGLAILTIPLMRHTGRKLLYRLKIWQLPTVIIGAKQDAEAAYLALQSEPLLGFAVTAFVSPTQSAPEALTIGETTLPVYTITDHDLAAVMARLQPTNIIIAVSAEELTKLQDQIEQLSLHYPHIYLIPSLAGLPLFGLETMHFFRHDVLFLRIRNNLASRAMQWLKRFFDIVAASLLLLLLSPVFAYLTYRIHRYGSKVFFAHQRIGRYGKAFTCYKFSSMVADAEEVLEQLLATDPTASAQWHAEFKLKDDPRITPLGRVLRQTSLDELPQLWNVLKGEMSLVGPRPVVKEELARYQDKIPFYLSIRPGITGLWQVSGRNDITYDERVALDTWYVKNWNVWYDIAILFKTVKAVLNRKGVY